MPNSLMKVEIDRRRNGETTNAKRADNTHELLTASADYFGLNVH